SGLKSGGPNYLIQLMQAEDVRADLSDIQIPPQIGALFEKSVGREPSPAESKIWKASIQSYVIWFRRFSEDTALDSPLGEKNTLQYLGRRKMVFRISKSLQPVDVIRTLACALLSGVKLSISHENCLENFVNEAAWHAFFQFFQVYNENARTFCHRLQTDKTERIRFLGTPSSDILEASASNGIFIVNNPVSLDGQIELLHFLREVCISTTSHRYGRLAE
ncbi:MAG: RHH-type proline utilization regulon transcriptional repressor/proline dehydrogenase, partial [Candidatus Marinamargulisbacteria bacterium]